MERPTYRFPYGRDEEGNPLIDAKIPPEQYAIYKRRIADIEESLEIARKNIRLDETHELSTINLEHLCVAKHETDLYRYIIYPDYESPDKKVSKSRYFISMVYIVLKFFDVVDVSIEQLLRISEFGGWEDEDAACSHFPDVICDAYGIRTTRLSKLQQILSWIDSGGLIVAIANGRLMFNSQRNVLLFVTEVSMKHNHVGIYFAGDPKNEEYYKSVTIEEFFENVKVIWGFIAENN